MSNKITTYTVNRILNATLTAQAADDTAVTGWAVANEFVVCFQVDATTPWGPETYKMQWRDDNDGTPTYVDLASTGEMKWGAGTSLVNGNPSSQRCTNVPGGSTWEAGVEVEGANTTGAFTHTDEYYTEFHFAIDPAGAEASHQYAFRLYAVTSAVAFGDGLATLATAAAATTYYQAVAGIFTATGAVGKLVKTARTAGTFVATGTIGTVKKVFQAVGGTFTATGTLAKKTGKAVMGSFTSGGVVNRTTKKILTGAFAPSGVISKVISKALAGLSTFTGVPSTSKETASLSSTKNKLTKKMLLLH